MKPADALIFILFGCALYKTYIVFSYPSFFGNTHFDLRIINGFSDNSSSPLIVLCDSQDGRDFGGRVLPNPDDFYGWAVKISRYFWSPQKFICTVKWDEKSKEFEAFRANRDEYRCGDAGECFWLVKEDGFYFSNNGFDWIKNFPWM